MERKLYCSFEGFKYHITPKPFIGAYVAMENFSRGLLKYGSFDEYHTYFDDHFFNSLTKDQVETAYFSHNKLKIMKLNNLVKESNIPYCVINFETIYPYSEAFFRNLIHKKNIPITRRAYTVATNANLREILNICLINDGGRSYDSIVVPSKPTRDALLNYLSDVTESSSGKLSYKGRIDVIPHGIDTEEFQPKCKFDARKMLGLPYNVTILLTVARISRSSKMNYDRLLEFFSRLIKLSKGNDLMLLISGSDQCNEARIIKEISNKLGIANKVKLIINFDDKIKKDIYSTADIFISLSDNLQESFGINLIEAMAMGLPVICTDWDGYKDIIEDEVTGYRIPIIWKIRQCPEDILVNFRNPYDHTVIHRISQDLYIDVNLLIERTLNLIHNENARKEIGKRARGKAIQNYSVKTEILRFESLWHELYEIAETDKNEYKDLCSILHYNYPKHFAGYPSSILYQD